jgi:hypothetical protein
MNPVNLFGLRALPGADRPEQSDPCLKHASPAAESFDKVLRDVSGRAGRPVVEAAPPPRETATASARPDSGGGNVPADAASPLAGHAGPRGPRHGNQDGRPPAQETSGTAPAASDGPSPIAVEDPPAGVSRGLARPFPTAPGPGGDPFAAFATARSIAPDAAPIDAAGRVRILASVRSLQWTTLLTSVFGHDATAGPAPRFGPPAPPFARPGLSGSPCRCPAGPAEALAAALGRRMADPLAGWWA